MKTGHWKSLQILLLAGLAPLLQAQNLSPSGISASPDSLSPGDEVTIEVAVSNSDTTALNNGNADFAFVFTNLKTGATFPITATNVSITEQVTAATAGANGAPGAPGTGKFKITATIPTATTQSGAYRATVTMSDPQGDAWTIGSAGYSESGTVLTVVGKPDFAITSLTYPAGISYEGGNTIPMSLTYTNRTSTDGTYNVPYVPGAIHASYFRIEIVLSSNPTFGDADDFLLTFHDISSQIDADSVNRTINWTQLLPGNFPGSFYVLAKIDTLAQVDETVEADLTKAGNNVWYDVNASRLALDPTNFPTIYLGSSGGDNWSDQPVANEDGRYTVFASDSTNLVTGDSNAQRDVFIYDQQNTTVRRLSVSEQGTQANGFSQYPFISADSTKVAFSSDATNLVLGDTNGFSDIFLVTTFTGAISRVNVASDGTQANGSSFRPALSRDGRYVVFESSATNLVTPATTFGVTHIYRHDSQTGTTVLVSADSSGTAGNGSSTQARVSADGRYVVFASDASNLVAADGNAVRDIFLRDVTNGTTVRVSVDATGGDSDGASRSPSLSADGAYVAFHSLADDLVANDTNAVADVFVRDIAAGTTTRVSVSTAGTEASDPSPSPFQLGSFNPSISASGRYVSFASLANNLTDGDSVGQYQTSDSNGALDIFVRDRDVSGSGTFDTPGNVATTMVSRNRFGYQTIRVLGQPSTAAADIFPSISADGRWVAFPSDAESASGLAHGATNRISNDDNTYRDVFIHDRRTNALPNPSNDPTISITAPVTGSTVAIGNTVTVVGSAVAPAGTVARVDFFVNGASLGSVTSAPYSVNWTPSVAGSYSLSALVVDSFGNQGVSGTIAITVSTTSPNLPQVSISQPIGGTVVPVNTTVDITAVASDTDGTIASVEFLANGQSLGSDTTFPYSFTWTPSATGSYSLTATATDSGGNSAVSSAVAVTVSGGGTPTVALTSPGNGASFVVGASAALAATASAVAPASVTTVRFLVNGQAVATDTTEPFTGIWTPVVSGTYNVAAEVTDSLGNISTSAVSTVTFTNNGSPSATLASPADGSSYIVGNSVPLLATASAVAPASVASVRFLVNGQAVATDTSEPFSATWTPAVSGVYLVAAEVTDTLGHITTSASSTVTFTANAAPSVTLVTPTTGTVGQSGRSLALSATASDSDGLVASVEFLANGVSLGTVTAQPYALQWTPANAGTFAIVARATDDLGNSTDSAAATLTVTANGAPSVALTSPTATVLPVNSSVNLAATATDADGTIASVEFFANGLSIGSDSTFPYSLTWSPTMTGAFSLTAVAVDNGGNSTESTPVLVTISGGGAPTVTLVSPATGSSSVVGVAVPLSATASAIAPATVASVQFFVNGVSIGNDAVEPFTGSWTPTASGAYDLTAQVTDSLGNLSTSASSSVTVTANAAPTVSLLSPAAGSSVQRGRAVTVSADAVDTDGTVTSVEFLVNGVSVGVDSAAPFSVQWKPSSTGTFSIVARATDNSGNLTSSTPVSITVTTNAAPVVALTSPGSGTYPVNTSINLIASATDSDGTISAVEFFANGLSIGTDTTFPYSLAWTPTVTGTFVFTVRATDDGAVSTDSSPVSVTISGGSAPSVALSAPVSGASYIVGTTVPLKATASAVAPASVASVRFLVNGQPFALDNTEPYTGLWTPVASGTYSVTAEVTDSLGNVATSPAATVNFVANGAPTVTVTSPSSGAVVQQGTPVTILASAADSDGLISSVTFLVNGTQVGSASAPPYTATWTPAGSGSFAIVARAIDNSGNLTDSAPVVVNALANGAPVVGLTFPNNGASITLGNAIELRANATDANGTIAGVDFYANGIQIGARDTVGPFSVQWTPTSAGIYRLQANATDNGGLLSVSSIVTVAVVDPSEADSLYSGIYLAGSEQGKFIMAKQGERGVTFIGYPDAGAAPTVYFYTGATVDAGGGFSLARGGSTVLSGSTFPAGVFGTFDGTRATFSGTLKLGASSTYAGPTGVIYGSLTGAGDSMLIALVGSDASIAVYAKRGSTDDATIPGNLASDGSFNLATVYGGTLKGRIDPSTGFLSATLSGSHLSGAVTAAASAPAPAADGFLRNLSTRGRVGTGDAILVAGFVVNGGSPKHVLIRAIGPTLSTFSVPGAVADTNLKLFQGSTVIASNDDWGSASGVPAATTAVGAFALPAGSADSALYVTLNPGPYTAQVAGIGGVTGVGMVEIYDVDAQTAFSAEKLMNVATRGEVGSGDQILIAGVTVNGTTPKRVLIRAVGPTLGSFGVSNPLSDPVLKLIRQSNGSTVRENDNWEVGNDAVDVADTSASVGAFALPAGSKDAALLITLPPGAYTALVSSGSGATGVAIVEVYEVQ